MEPVQKIEDELATPVNFRLVGIVCPGGPAGIGNIYVPETLIAQKGLNNVLCKVEEIYLSAYAKWERERGKG